MPEVTATPPVSITSPNGASSECLLSVQNAEKTFGSKQNLVKALDGISFDVNRGEYVAIMGPSGSGKTTLLNCISTIDKVSSGRIIVNGQDITKMSKKKLVDFRRDELGFIFQDSNLIETLTGRENIALSLTIKGAKPSIIAQKIDQIARTLGVTESLSQYPAQMSGGQRQRVAAARAIVGDPSLILADEPTGALDSKNATIMLETLGMMNVGLGATILMVTHDAYAASFSNRALFISDGKIFNEIRRGFMGREEYFERIMEVVAFLGGETSHAV